MRGKILFVLLFFALVACAPMSKDDYMKSYLDFINEVDQNAVNYTEIDWGKQDKIYEKYSEVWYKKFYEEFTVSDKIKLTAYKVKYKYYRGLNKYGNKIIGFADSVNLESSISLIKSMGDKLLNDIDDGISDLNKLLDDCLEDIDTIPNHSDDIE